MILVDANLLLYAYDSRSPRHEVARTWLEATLDSDEQVGFALVTLMAFIRIGTSPAVFERPLPVGTAIDLVEGWLRLPNVALTEPSGRHWVVLARVADAGQVTWTIVPRAGRAERAWTLAVHVIHAGRPLPITKLLED